MGDLTRKHVESTIKRINRRMKGSEKFWDEGAEPLPHLVADHLVADHLGPKETMNSFWTDRSARLDSWRRYHCPA